MSIDDLKSEYGSLLRSLLKNLANQQEFYQKMFEETGIKEGSTVSFQHHGKSCVGKITKINYMSYGTVAFMHITKKGILSVVYEDQWHTLKVISSKQKK